MQKYLLVILIILGIVGYFFLKQFSFSQPSQKYSGPPEKVTLGVFLVAENNTLPLIAQKNGYFADNGLEVISKTYNTSAEAEAALAKGEIDMNMVVDFTNVGTLFNRPSERILARIATANPVKYVAKKQGGIKTFRDLKGKKIGLSKNIISRFFLSRNLGYVGLTLDDVTLVDAPLVKIGELLASDQVDFIISYEPFATNTITAIGPDNNVSLASYTDDTTNILLVADQSFITSHVSLTQRFLRSFVQAEEFIKNNNSQAKKIVAQSSITKPEDFDRVWQLFHFELDLPQTLLLSMEDKARWHIENKLTDKKKVPNFLDFIYFDGLVAVKPEAITIIR